jgi:flagellar protein FliJ
LFLVAAKGRGHSVDNRAVTTGPSFRFRLERVRAVRARSETIAKQELARAVSQLSSTQADLRAAEADLEHARFEQRSAASEPGTIASTDLLARQAFLERAEAKRRAQELELARREGEVADRDAQLSTASSEHEMLNRLRERHRGEHDREAARRERNTLDEIATVRFGRTPV